MSNTTIQNVEFYGKPIPTVLEDGTHYIGMKGVCENIGLGWRGQNERIQRHEVLSSVARVIRSTGKDGKEYKVLCLPLSYLNGWLFGVDISRIKREEVRQALIKYQRECFQVLYEYWHNGKAENPRTNPDERAGLRAAVTVLTTKRGLMHGEAYKLVHQRFNVEHIEEIPREKLGEAVEYVHRLALEGEYIPRDKDDPRTPEYYREQHVAGIALMRKGLHQFYEHQVMKREAWDMAIDVMDKLDEANKVANALCRRLNRMQRAGWIYDGLAEAQFKLCDDMEVMREGIAMAEKRIAAR